MSAETKEQARAIHATLDPVALLREMRAAQQHLVEIADSTLPDGTKPKKTQMRFAPNSGYAFAVDDHTWHSADPVGPQVKTRDSILLTYFVDSGPLRILRNRGKRLGNFLLNELRNKA